VEATNLIRLLEAFAPPALTAAVVSRHIGLTADRVLSGEIQADAVIGELDEQVAYLRSLGSDPDLGSAPFSVAKVMSAQDVRRALDLAHEARGLVGAPHTDTVDTLIAMLERDPAN
jgi:hypothetical protein